MSQWHGGKGSTPRKVDKKKFDENWDRIFGKKEQLTDLPNEKTTIKNNIKKDS